MKLLVVSIAFLASVFAHAGTVEMGKYSAVDADTKTIVASFELKPDASLTFTVKSTDGSLPQTNCTGKYTVKGNNFSADLKCQSALLPSASVVIDITNVTPQSLRSARGAEVNVTIDALGSDPTLFLLKKAD